MSSCSYADNIVFLYWCKLIWVFLNLKLCHKYDRLEIPVHKKGRVFDRFVFYRHFGPVDWLHYV